jgi:hypothetical protein
MSSESQKDDHKAVPETAAVREASPESIHRGLSWLWQGRRKLWLYLSISVVLIFIWDGRFLLSPNVGILDWKKELYYFHYLHSNILEFGISPISFVYPLPPNLGYFPVLIRTLSCWANPEMLVFSPLLILVPFFSTVGFIKVYFFLNLVIAAGGALILSRRLGFDHYEALIFFVLIVLNPWLMQHMAIGYTSYVPCCLIPLVTAMLIGPFSIRDLVIASCANALIIYGGGQHVFMWLNASLGLFCLVHTLRRRDRSFLAKLLVFYLMSVLLVFPRVVAVLVVFRGFRRDILGSYSSIRDLWGVLTDTKAPLYDLPRSDGIFGTSPYDAIMGISAWFIVLLVGCVIWSLYQYFKSADFAARFPSFELLLLASVFCIFGWDGVWSRLAHILPLLDSEIYPWRFLAISIFLLFAFIFWEVRSFVRGVVPARFQRVVLPLLVLPIIVAGYWRNQFFVNVSISQPDPLATYNVRSAFAAQGIPLNSESSPDRIMIYPTASGFVSTPWLGHSARETFNVENGQPNQIRDAAELRFVDRNKPIVLRPQDYWREQLLVIGMLLYGLVTYAASRYERRQYGQRAGPTP